MIERAPEKACFMGLFFAIGICYPIKVVVVLAGDFGIESGKSFEGGRRIGRNCEVERGSRGLGWTRN
jgi:hypothetical protein